MYPNFRTNHKKKKVLKIKPILEIQNRTDFQEKARQKKKLGAQIKSPEKQDNSYE